MECSPNVLAVLEEISQNAPRYTSYHTEGRVTLNNGQQYLVTSSPDAGRGPYLSFKPVKRIPPIVSVEPAPMLL